MKLPNRAIQITFLTQGHTKVGVEDCVIRSESGRLAELSCSSFRIATGFERDAQVVARRGKTRRQSHCLLVLGNGLFDLPFVFENPA